MWAMTVSPRQTTGSRVASGKPSGPVVTNCALPTRATSARTSSSASIRLTAGTYISYCQYVGLSWCGGCFATEVGRDVRHRASHVVILLAYRRHVVQRLLGGVSALCLGDDPGGQVRRRQASACRRDVA